MQVLIIRALTHSKAGIWLLMSYELDELDSTSSIVYSARKAQWQCQWLSKSPFGGNAHPQTQLKAQPYLANITLSPLLGGHWLGDLRQAWPRDLLGWILEFMQEVWRSSLFSEVVERAPNGFMIGYLQTNIMRKQKLWLGKESKPFSRERMEQSGSHTKDQVADETPGESSVQLLVCAGSNPCGSSL